MPQTAQQLYFDSLLRHQIYLLRLAGSLRNEVVRLLDATDLEIAEQIAGRLGTNKRPIPTRLAQADRLFRDLRRLRDAAWQEASKTLRRNLDELTQAEVRFLQSAVEASVYVELETLIPPVSKLKALVTNSPMQGRVMSDWASTLRRQDRKRIEDQIRIGIVQGQSSQDIARRVVGTARLRGRDGATQITRRNAQAIARTAVIHFSNAARGEFLQANARYFRDELYAATLDGRTTPICRSLDGNRYPVGVGPQPPVHWQCRSVRVATFDGDTLGERPFKATTQRMMLREYARLNGLPTPLNRAALPRGHKGPFDAFSRRRGRELTGRVPLTTTYQEWLRTQTREFQDDVLGATRARLFRRGGLQLSKFVNRKGDEITLADLAKKERQAFLAAGLDPGNFT